MRRWPFASLPTADNMSDEISGLRLLVHGGSARGEEALAIFEAKWAR